MPLLLLTRHHLAHYKCTRSECVTSLITGAVRLCVLILLIVLRAMFARLSGFVLRGFILSVQWCSLVGEALLVLPRVRHVVVPAITQMRVNAGTGGRSVLIRRLSRTLGLRYRARTYRHHTRCYSSGDFSFY